MMKIIPFPLSVNIGNDIVHLPRISQLLAGAHANRFIRRILRDQEMDDFQRRFNRCCKRGDGTRRRYDDDNHHHLLLLPNLNLNFNHPGELELNISRWIAGRFAAKEAARKAAPKGASSLNWKDILVRIEGTGREGGDGDGDGHELGQSQLQTSLANPQRSQSQSQSQRPEVLYLRGYKEHDRRQRMIHDGDIEGMNENRDRNDYSGRYSSSSTSSSSAAATEHDEVTMTVARVGKLTISHDGEYVMATVIAAGDD